VSAEENEALLRSYMNAVWNAGNPDAAEQYLAPDFRRHTSATATPLDVMGQLQRLHGFRDAFPDAAITIEDVIAAPDRVAFRSTLRGTHLGTFLGIAPTGREVLVGLVDIIRIENGRFVEQWGGPDLFDLMRQLGAA
jgi:steroid delta-isomerase-like uncharacterized protein